MTYSPAFLRAVGLTLEAEGLTLFSQHDSGHLRLADSEPLSEHALTDPAGGVKAPDRTHVGVAELGVPVRFAAARADSYRAVEAALPGSDTRAADGAETDGGADRFANLAQLHPLAAEAADRRDLSLAEGREGVLLAGAGEALGNEVGLVVLVVPQKQVGRVAARLVVAAVEYPLVARTREGQSPSETMAPKAKERAVDAEVDPPVAIGVAVSCPLMATIAGAVHSLPERGDSLRSKVGNRGRFHRAKYSIERLGGLAA